MQGAHSAYSHFRFFSLKNQTATNGINPAPRNIESSKVVASTGTSWYRAMKTTLMSILATHAHTMTQSAVRTSFSFFIFALPNVAVDRHPGAGLDGDALRIPGQPEHGAEPPSSAVNGRTRCSPPQGGGQCARLKGNSHVPRRLAAGTVSAEHPRPLGPR